MLFVYPAIFHKEKDYYWVEFPDLEGCCTHGDTIVEAMAMAQEAMTGYLLSLLADGDDIPFPSDIASLHPSDGFATLVSCEASQEQALKTVEKTLAIPSWLNDRAMAMGLDFSKVFQDALIARIMA